jgi:rSAM/selenodomain-associated transferase 1
LGYCEVTRRAHLVVMARAPRLGAVKRRLARDIGDLAALRFYRQTLRALVRDLTRDPRWRVSLAVTPDRAARGKIFGANTLEQGRGDLGARMGRFLRARRAGPVVIVGTDIPDLGRDQVARAFHALKARDWVLGPSGDGGYWLIGASRLRRMPHDPFAGVRWSSAHTRADTLANLRGARIALLEELDDIDTGADLARHRR